MIVELRMSVVNVWADMAELVEVRQKHSAIEAKLPVKHGKPARGDHSYALVCFPAFGEVPLEKLSDHRLHFVLVVYAWSKEPCLFGGGGLDQVAGETEADASTALAVGTPLRKGISLFAQRDHERGLSRNCMACLELLGADRRPDGPHSSRCIDRGTRA
ncbi:hypothetical protein O4214_17785 [Rhodococcus erythropolis]|uniref:hypothetical protein n=1 Tax=Rhodococcus erythropolis TaxID=1833 RepID=UPI001E65CFD5|nr:MULTISPECIES: hypothetical protein [Rhodococcus erythropolis group]MCD2106991.1 hypothetical protein [Rhodococcus qingshengii]MCZ4525842.1 hypothetical protein [Rhodococcus erythropolis]